MSDKLTERKIMSASAEASTLLRQIAGKGEPGEYKKEAWARAYRRLAGQWTFNRVKDLWREEPRAKVSAEELNQLRTVAKVTAGPGNDILARLESVEQMLRTLASRLPQDAEFYGAQADQLRDAARDVGRKNHS
jgi:hypothetical protein